MRSVCSAFEPTGRGYQPVLITSVQSSWGTLVHEQTEEQQQQQDMQQISMIPCSNKSLPEQAFSHGMDSDTLRCDTSTMHESAGEVEHSINIQKKLTGTCMVLMTDKVKWWICIVVVMLLASFYCDKNAGVV